LRNFGRVEHLNVSHASEVEETNSRKGLAPTGARPSASKKANFTPGILQVF
jgi:hypothetical protein